MKGINETVFIDPFTDFGAKRLFGPLSSSTSLIDFLNSVLKLEKLIVKIEFITTEQLGELIVDRKSVFDIHARDEGGNYIIVEIQRLKKEFFKDRSIFYSTYPIRAQSERGKWNFELKKIYTVCILDFCFDDTHPNQMVHRIKLIDEDTHTVFCDRLMYWYIEIPKFKKTEEELDTRQDKWFYTLKNLTKFSEIPLILADDSVFKSFFMDAKTAHLTELELQAYYSEKRLEWDKYAELEYAEKAGFKSGISQGMFLAAENMLRNHADIQFISKCTGLDIADIKKLAVKIGKGTDS